VPIVLGGVEASLRRLSHYDFWEDKMRRSILLDAKADLLLYGMAEESVVALARALAEGRTLDEARQIRGACYLAPESEVSEDTLRLPGFEEVRKEPLAFTRSYRVRHRAADPHANQRLAEPYGKRWVIQQAPPLPLSREKLDGIYELPFTRAIHPCYGKKDVPALRTVLTSMVTHRGCFGGCSFCSIGFHQGRTIQDRSQASLIREVESLTRDPRFKGTLNDLAGPSANMYGYTCKRTAAGKACKRPHCLHPEPCKRLTEGYDRIISLLRAVRKVPGVKHAFIQSGIRHDLTLCDKGLAYLEEVVNHHVSGTLKVAPEHSEKKVLDLMRKPDFALYEEFKAIFDRMNRQAGLRQYLVSYLISAHPGCGMKEMKALKDKLNRMGLKPEQIQDYTPLPGTEASVMFATGLDPFTDRPLFVARTDRERRDQRRVIQPPGEEGRATDWET
jgi:uncharacterized radical SAM protein YgiQ